MRWLTWKLAQGWMDEYAARTHASLDDRMTLCGKTVHQPSAKTDDLRPRCQKCAQWAIKRGLL